MTDKHTPGPWQVFYKAKYDEWHVSVPQDIRGMNVALFPDGIPRVTNNSDNREANARLIAAAPDIYGLLLEMIDIHGPAHENECPQDDTCDCKYKTLNDRINRVVNQVEARGISL